MGYWMYFWVFMFMLFLLIGYFDFDGCYCLGEIDVCVYVVVWGIGCYVLFGYIFLLLVFCFDIMYVLL